MLNGWILEQRPDSFDSDAKLHRDDAQDPRRKRTSSPDRPLYRSNRDTLKDIVALTSQQKKIDTKPPDTPKTRQTNMISLQPNPLFINIVLE
jgi:hypothetical protein